MTTAPNHPTDDPDDDGSSPEHTAEPPNQSTTGRVQSIGDDAGTLGTGASLPTIAAHLSSPESRKDLLIERYKLIEPIGEGGMGTVWRAQQVKPVRREVAVKLIKPGMDSKSVLARFDAERQALAIMDHPNIARVLDGGMADDGRPYFVMELVRGLPLTDYCDQKRLTIQQRLELFAQICSAVQHAHQKGIIHRDLKPSNILVTEVDNQPVPKVIDFGLAKALGSSTMLTEQTLHTGIGMILGTPLYMAPEQLDAGALDIDTRADIYSLGVILYELLTGSTPFDRQKFKNAALDEIKRIVREEEPLKPSSRLSSIDTLPGVASTRHSEPVSLHRLVRGELDWIVMKSLEKDRHHRYETANALSADVQRYLTGEPITAAPPSAAYRIRKFVRKNRGPVIAASLVVSTLIFGMAGTGLFAIRENRARSATEQARQLAEQKTAEVLIEKQNVETERLKAEEEAREADRQRNIALQREKEAQSAEENAAHQAERAMREAQRASREAESARQSKLAAEKSLEKSEATLARSNYYLAVSRWNEGRASEAKRLLHQIPEKYRDIEWYIDNRVFDGSDLTLYGHSGAVKSVDVHPDGTQLVSAGSDGNLIIWNAETGELLNSMRAPSAAIASVKYSADGLTIVSRNVDQTRNLWDAVTGTQLKTLESSQALIEEEHGPEQGQKRIRYSYHYDNDNNTIKIREASSGQFVKSIGSKTEPIKSHLLSPDGKFLAIGFASNMIQLWSLSTGKLLNNFSYGGKSGVLEFSPDGKLLASTDAKIPESIHLWNVANGAKFQVLEGNGGELRCIAFAPDATSVAACSNDGTIRIWDIGTGSLRRRFNGHLESINCLKYCSDARRLISGSADGSSKIWDINGDSAIRFSLESPEPTSSCEFSPSGRLLALGATDGSIRLFDLRTAELLHEFKQHTGAVSALCFSTDGSKLASGGSDQKIHLWDTSLGSHLKSIHPRIGEIRSISYCCGDMQIAVGSLGLVGGTIGLWDAVSGQRIPGVDVTLFGVPSLAYNPHGQKLAYAEGLTRAYYEDSSIRIIDCLDGKDVLLVGFLEKIQRLLRGPLVSHIEFNGNGKLLGFVPSFRDAGIEIEFQPIPQRRLSEIVIVDANDGREISSIRDQVDLFSSFGFTETGDRIVSRSLDHTVKIWDTYTGDELRTLHAGSNPVIAVHLNADGGQLAMITADNEVRLWNSERRSEMHILEAGSSDLRTAGITSDGKYVVAKDDNERTWCWNVQSGTPCKENAVENASDLSIRSADNRWLVLVAGNSVFLVDMQYKKFEQESKRQVESRIDVDWHQQRSQSAEESDNWFAAAFHRAWIVRARPDDLEAHDSLHRVHQQLLKQDEAKGQQQASLLPPAVKEALAMPRPSDSTVGESSAE